MKKGKSSLGLVVASYYDVKHWMQTHHIHELFSRDNVVHTACNIIYSAVDVISFSSLIVVDAGLPNLIGYSLHMRDGIKGLLMTCMEFPEDAVVAFMTEVHNFIK